jgi:hypothetical protein
MRVKGAFLAHLECFVLDTILQLPLEIVVKVITVLKVRALNLLLTILVHQATFA